MKRNSILLVSFTLLFLIGLMQPAAAQRRISSPYTKYGVGRLAETANAYNMAMGGIAYGLRNPVLVNPDNPATYAGYDSISFVFNLGLASRHTQLSSSNLKESSHYTSLGYMLFGTPVTKWWRSSAGLLPFSQVGYNVIDKKTDSLAGYPWYIFDGEGGINRLFWGNSINITPSLSVGFNLNYYFGTIDHARSVVFTDPERLLMNYKILDEVRVSDWGLDFGLNYFTMNDKGRFFSTGAVFNNGKTIKAVRERIGFTYIEGTTNPTTHADTIVYEPEKSGGFFLPMGAGLGISFGEQGKWLLGADAHYQQWEKFEFFDRSDSLRNTLKVALGGEFTPSNSTTARYWERITYRAGARYNQTYLSMRGQDLNEFGISFGLGLPIPRTRTNLNIALEAGSMGTQKENLVREDFFRFTVGLSFFENWYITRKYN